MFVLGGTCRFLIGTIAMAAVRKPYYFEDRFYLPSSTKSESASGCFQARMILPILKSSLDTSTGAASATFFSLFPAPFSAFGLDAFSFFFELVALASETPVAPSAELVVVVDVLVGVSTLVVAVDDS